MQYVVLWIPFQRVSQILLETGMGNTQVLILSSSNARSYYEFYYLSVLTHDAISYTWNVYQLVSFWKGIIFNQISSFKAVI